LVSGAFVSRLDTEVDGWRSRDVVEMLESELASVRIEMSDDVIEATRVNDTWQLSQPVADLADAEQMRSLVSELNALRISEFLPEGTPEAFLDPTLVEYRVELHPGGEEPPLILELGAPVEGRTGLVCRRNGEESFRIPDGIRARIGKAPVLWRSAKVWPFSSFDVGTVEISNASETVVLESVDHVWTLADGAEAEQAEVRRRLNALSDLEAREHDLVHPPTDVLGSVIVVLDDGGGADRLTYTFFAPIEEGGHAAVKLSSRANVMGVDAAMAETIVGNLEALRPFTPEVGLDGESTGSIE
jgi:hypothetical protein